MPLRSRLATHDMQDIPDEALMQAYAHGDTAAFDALYARHEAALLRFVRRLLGQRLAAQADEVFQDTWMRIISARNSFDASLARWRTWAFTIAHNLAMDRLRTSGREWSPEAADPGDTDTPDPMDWLQEALDLAHPSAEDIAHWRAAGHQLLQCLEALPAPQRAVFLLHHEEDSSVEELARQLGLGYETVKSRLRYALAKLRGCMQHYLQPLGAPR